MSPLPPTWNPIPRLRKIQARMVRKQLGHHLRPDLCNPRADQIQRGARVQQMHLSAARSAYLSRVAPANTSPTACKAWAWMPKDGLPRSVCAASTPNPVKLPLRLY